jgi:Ser/Thr protein kinase RdoA (MazF antagonist)
VIKPPVVRSTLAETWILQEVRTHYPVFGEDARCMFEYRGLNDLYKITAGGLSCFFKIYARQGLDPQAIQAEVELVIHLNRSGFPVASPIPMSDGQYLLPIDTPEGTRHGVLFTAAEGLPCSNDSLDEQDLIQISNLASEMHTLLDAIPASPARWKLDETLFLDRSIGILEDYNLFNPLDDLPFLQQVASELKQKLLAGGGAWNWGLCHGDFYTGNLHRTQTGALTLFDFDFSGYGWRAYDVSPFLGNFSSGVGQEALEERKRRLDHFLKVYQHAGGFSDAEIEAFYTIFVPFRRIFNLGYLYHELHYVCGNSLRNNLIAADTRRLKQWVEHYW